MNIYFVRLLLEQLPYKNNSISQLHSINPKYFNIVTESRTQSNSIQLYYIHSDCTV
jgi:hypothetical protein